MSPDFSEFPSSLLSALATYGLHSTMMVATVGDSGVAITSASCRTSQSFRATSPRQCMFEWFDNGEDDELLTNIRSDGRLTISFEVSSPSPQHVKISGRASVLDQGSLGYTPTNPANWMPKAIVSVVVQRISSQNAGPLILSTDQSVAFRPITQNPIRLPALRDEQRLSMYANNRGRRHLDSPLQAGWPSAGDSCCAS